MKVAVILRLVPDVVEELVIADDGRSLAEDEGMYITNELDGHALEQALLLKERRGARPTAGGPRGASSGADVAPGERLWAVGVGLAPPPPPPLRGGAPGAGEGALEAL